MVNPLDRKIGLFFSFLILSKGSFCQAKDNFKREVGIGTSSIPFLILNIVPALNISFKAINNKNALRTGISFNIINPFSPAYLINAGYERRFFNGKSQLLIGGDIGYNTFGSTKTIGLGPAIGYILNPSKTISLQTEVGVF